MDKLEREIRGKELLEVTGSPNTKAPCVCGGGIGILINKDDSNATVDADSMLALKRNHSEYCIRFMQACAAKISNSKSHDSNHEDMTDASHTPIKLIKYVSMHYYVCK